MTSSPIVLGVTNYYGQIIVPEKLYEMEAAIYEYERVYSNNGSRVVLQITPINIEK